jgi:ubiquitin C-terminal hydrolase
MPFPAKMVLPAAAAAAGCDTGQCVAQQEGECDCQPSHYKSGVYDLSSVILHMGSALSGHYICAARTGPNEWTIYDDKNVYPVDWETLTSLGFGGGQSSCSAYLLIYTLK